MRQTVTVILGLAAILWLCSASAPAGDQVEKWLTTPNLKAALTRQSDLQFEKWCKTRLDVTTVDPSVIRKFWAWAPLLTMPTVKTETNSP